MADQRKPRGQADPAAGAVEPGFTRLYRVEPDGPDDKRPDWIRQAQAETGHLDAEGRWFVADAALLAWYREDASGPTRTAYVDVPSSDLEQYRVANSEERIGVRPVKSFSRDPENEFFLPRTLADAKEVLHDAPADDRADGRGEYQVWHIDDYEQALLNRFRGADDPAFPEAYTRVATVRAGSLDQVFALTNDGENPWQENPGVIGIDARCTSVGDVIIDPQGKPYRVENTGFKELPASDESSLNRVERVLRELKQEPEIHLESTRHYVQPDPESCEGIYDTCDTLKPWHTLDDVQKLRVLEGELDWGGVGDEDKEAVLVREVDLSKVTPAERRRGPGGADSQSPPITAGRLISPGEIAEGRGGPEPPRRGPQRKRGQW